MKFLKAVFARLFRPMVRRDFPELGLSLALPSEWTVAYFKNAVVFLTRQFYPGSFEEVSVSRGEIALVLSLSETTVGLKSLSRDLSPREKIPGAVKLFEISNPFTPTPKFFSFVFEHHHEILSFQTKKGIVSAALFMGPDFKIDFFLDQRKLVQEVFESIEELDDLQPETVNRLPVVTGDKIER